MAEKLFQNRIVIIGRNYQDAHEYANGPRFRDDLESPTLVSAAAHPLTVSGGVGGMHIATIYVTPTAPEAVDFDKVLATVERAAKKNPDYKVVEEPRVVKA